MIPSLAAPLQANQNQLFLSMNSNMLLFSPMEQYIIIPLLNFNITLLNNISFYLIISIILISLLQFIGNRKLIPNYMDILNESFYRTILNMIESFLGLKGTQFLPLLYTIFYLILFSNCIGLIPYSSTTTVEIILTLSLAFLLLIGFLILGFMTHRLYLLSIFLPGGTPIGLIPLLIPLEIMAFLFRTISLGLRLAINLITGKILTKVIMGFIWSGYTSNVSFIILLLPIFLITLFLCLEILISYLQAYIFLFITILTIQDLQIID
ncbi:ATP synthase F0 subunit 6 [Batrachochytrium dendrobatidis]|nr:ATP synthase F0 subunit 6 [Batrachochytrium dendrobatidis]